LTLVATSSDFTESLSEIVLLLRRGFAVVSSSVIGTSGRVSEFFICIPSVEVNKRASILRRLLCCKLSLTPKMRVAVSFLIKHAVLLSYQVRPALVYYHQKYH